MARTLLSNQGSAYSAGVRCGAQFRAALPSAGPASPSARLFEREPLGPLRPTENLGLLRDSSGLASRCGTLVPFRP
jgi:hypothetical protein